MTEMEQEKRVSLNADVIMRRALDLKAEFHQLRYDDKDFENQYNADEFQEWYMDYINTK